MCTLQTTQYQYSWNETSKIQKTGNAQKAITRTHINETAWRAPVVVHLPPQAYQERGDPYILFSAFSDYSGSALEAKALTSNTCFELSVLSTHFSVTQLHRSFISR
jgi:hypothetical protein